jgi:hypothetical protein
MLPSIESIRSRRDFVLSAAAFSLSAILPHRLLAQQIGLPLSEGDDPKLAVIPKDTHLKFNPDGTRRPFAGNTVICHLPQQSQVHDTVTAVGDALRSSSFAPKLAILPSDSYHVTILGGANDLDRSQSEWPQDVPFKASITECNRIIGQRFAQFKIQEEMPIRFRLDKEKTIAPQLASGLQFVPAYQNEKVKLRRLRDRLADEVFLYRAKNHATFGFHISLAYQMRGFTLEERREYQDILQHHIPIIVAAAPVIELGVPEFCTFEDMYRFEIRTLLRT